MTPLETPLLVSFAMLTCLQTTLTWLNSRIRRGLIARSWPVATWEPIIGGHAQCVWRTICISLPLSLWGDGTLLAGTLAVSTAGTSCIYLFFALHLRCLSVRPDHCQILLCVLFFLSCIDQPATTQSQKMILMMHSFIWNFFAITSVGKALFPAVSLWIITLSNYTLKFCQNYCLLWLMLLFTIPKHLVAPCVAFTAPEEEHILHELGLWLASVPLFTLTAAAATTVWGSTYEIHFGASGPENLAEINFQIQQKTHTNKVCCWENHLYDIICQESDRTAHN